MRKIASQTKETAYAYLKEFGFDDEQIYSLIEKGLNDINIITDKLETQLNSEIIIWDDVDDTLHALKGLLFHMGNIRLAEIIDQERIDIRNIETTMLLDCIS